MATGDDPAALNPMVQRGAGHVQGTGQIGQPPVVRRERGRASGAWLVGTQLLEQGADRLGTEPFGGFRRMIAFLPQAVGDRWGFIALLR